jgi:hypothetical protein
VCLKEWEIELLHTLGNYIVTNAGQRLTLRGSSLSTANGIDIGFTMVAIVFSTTALSRRAGAMERIVRVDLYQEHTTTSWVEFIIEVTGIFDGVANTIQDDSRICTEASRSNINKQFFRGIVADNPWRGDIAHGSG